jgi:hypothetical protein
MSGPNDLQLEPGQGGDLSANSRMRQLTYLNMSFAPTRKRFSMNSHGGNMKKSTSTIVAPELAISPEKVCFIVIKGREFDAKDIVTDPDESSNASDDAMRSVLEDHPDDPVLQELVAFIGALTEDEQIDLVTLAWLGRGDGTIEDWAQLRAEAARAHNRRTARYLLGMPLLPDHLEDALSQLGRSCEEFEVGRL